MAVNVSMSTRIQATAVPVAMLATERVRAVNAFPLVVAVGLPIAEVGVSIRTGIRPIAVAAVFHVPVNVRKANVSSLGATRD